MTSLIVFLRPLGLRLAPQGVDKADGSPNDLLPVDVSGSVLSGTGKASAETSLHLEIVQTCDAGAVLHTHSQAGTLLSQWALEANGGSAPRDAGHLELRDLEMLKGLEGVTTHKCSVRVPVLANDQNLERLSARARPDLISAPHGLLIAGHGLYAWGRNLGSAMRHLEILEFLLEQRWRQLLLNALTHRLPH